MPLNSKGVKMARQKIEGGVKTTLILNEKAHTAIKKYCLKHGDTMAFFMRTAIYMRIIQKGGLKK
jgi:hypothetical protein